ISLPTNGFGTRWGDYNGTQAFYDGNGSLFAYNASGVIDVSEYQKEINWAAAKAAGVEGAIIRISYGWENGYDKYALRNIRECKRLGIPFGIYMYSYAEKPEDGANEGA
ncbi:GH25 family lysozyme, partial [Gardnerella vaginalis]